MTFCCRDGGGKPVPRRVKRVSLAFHTRLNAFARTTGRAPGSLFPLDEPEVRGGIAEEKLRKQRAVLMILLATCERALEAFQVADNIADDQFVVDLERVTEPTKRELQALNERLAAQASG